MSFIVEIDNENNKLEESLKVKEKTKTSRSRSSRSKIYNSESENLSLSDLDLIANKRKLAKKSETDTLSRESSKKKEKEKDTHSSISTLDKDKNKNTNNGWNGNRFINENENPQIRKEKSEYLYKYNKLNAGNKYSSCQFDMNSSLADIRNEYDRIKNGIENERSVKFLQRMMLLMIQGVEMLNTKFDPLGVDLDGWGESMAYSLETQEYDEVLSELYEKYKGAGNMSPELRLLFMIISSASMFAITKRLTKNETNIGNLLNNLMGGGGGSSGNKTNQPIVDDKESTNDMSSTNDDIIPSKLNGPEDDISINEILSKMNMNKSKKKDESVDIRDIGVDEKTEDVLKNIIVPPAKKRGRPSRQKVNKAVANPF